MYNRKKFLKLSGGAAFGLFAAPSLLASCNSANNKETQPGTDTTGKAAANPDAGLAGISALGLQLYSLRDDLPKDPKGILKQVASFGYKEVESFEGAQGMFWGMGHTGFKQYMDELGMKIVSSHCDYKKDFEKIKFKTKTFNENILKKEGIINLIDIIINEIKELENKEILLNNKIN